MAFWDTAKSETIYTWNPTPGRGQRNDVSIPLPQGTPINAPVNGIVLPQNPGQGGLYSYYGRQPWGGEVDILTNLNDYGGPQVVQLLHMDTISVQPGQVVSKGDVLGTSGGQTSGGNWPSSPQYSSGPHIGLAVHSVSSWDRMYNPQGLLSDLWAGRNTSSVPTQNQIISAGVGPILGPILGSVNTPTLTNPATTIWTDIQTQFKGAFTWLRQPIRIGKLLTGVLLVLGGFALFLLPDIAAAGVTAAGVPEAAGPVREALSGRSGGAGSARAGLRTVGAIQGQKTLARRQEKGRRAGVEQHRQIFVQAGRKGGQAAAAKRRAAKAAAAKRDEEAPPPRPKPAGLTPGTPEYEARQAQYRQMRETLDT